MSSKPDSIVSRASEVGVFGAHKYFVELNKQRQVVCEWHGWKSNKSYCRLLLPFYASGACEGYRNVSPFILQFTTISIKSVISTTGQISSCIAPRLLPNGVSLVQYKVWCLAAN